MGIDSIRITEWPQRLNQRLKSPVGAAECHGVLCGMLCLLDEPINGWLSECIELDDEVPPAAEA